LHSSVAEKGVIEIGQALRSLPHLQKIDLNFGSSMTDEVLNQLGKELKLMKNLQTLNFSVSQYKEKTLFINV